MKTSTKVRLDNKIFTTHFSEIDCVEKLKFSTFEHFLIHDKQLIPTSIACLRVKESENRERETDSPVVILKGNQKFRSIIKKRIILSKILDSGKNNESKNRLMDLSEVKITEIKHHQDEINTIIDIYNASTFKLLVLVDFGKRNTKEITHRIQEHLKFKNSRVITLDGLSNRLLDQKTVLCVVCDSRFLKEHWTQIKSINCKIKNVFLFEEDVF